MKRLQRLLLCCFFLAALNIPTSCETEEAPMFNDEEANNDSPEPEQDENDDTDNGNSNEEDAPADNDETSETISLTASSDFLTSGGSGDQSWGDNITMNAIRVNGQPGKVVFETRFTDNGFGVAGGRWEQIDYYHEYQGQIVNSSEKLVLIFNAPVSNVVLQVGQLHKGEGRRAKSGTTCSDGDLERVDESGKWTAYDVNNQEIGSGILLEEYSIDGKIANSAGAFKFELEAGNSTIKKLVIEATQWGGDERGCPTSRPPNNTLNDSGNSENNSEFNLMGISYTQ
ncbi:MAG: hypothetical protein AAFO99_07575 [Bacteroidota bacterium]